MTCHTRIILPLLLLAGRALADDSDSADVPLVFKVLHYYPNKAAAVIFAGLYLITGLVIFRHVRSYGDSWGMCLPIGIICMVIGYTVRFVEVISDSFKDSIGMYSFQTFFILCSPAAFLAFNYTLYGRVVVQCIGSQYSIIRPERIAKIFVISDVTTFFLQAIGGGLSATSNANMTKLGTKLAIVGLVAQGVSYAFFLFVVMTTHRRYISSHSAHARYHEVWWNVMWLLYFSSVPIMIRSIYRIAEFAQGSSGYLVTHEIFFYGLDGLPLLIAVLCYAVRWPGQYITETSETYKMNLGSSISVV
ncbi:RTA1-domain-containing protein [Heliocybe sulcata]|uniref:RTA1-domain-containing protein n=1 Tax=Heliocybe sulcata TaxID=5364 RepID=A0A5C3MKG5_9AGAM|nr:RTA1-domain-containing protein [Heliocybe sulcata]